MTLRVTLVCISDLFEALGRVWYQAICRCAVHNNSSPLPLFCLQQLFFSLIGISFGVLGLGSISYISFIGFGCYSLAGL